MVADSLRSIGWTLFRIAALLIVCIVILFFAMSSASPERQRLEEHGVNLESDETGELFAVGLTADALYDQIGEDIALIKSLKRVHLEDLVCTNEILNAIAELPNLQTVSCRGCTISDKQLAMLSHKHLQSIDLSNSDGPLHGISALGQQDELQSVVLSGCQWLSDEELQHLSQLPQLQSIEFQNTPITDDGIASLKSCSGLKHVTLSNCVRLTSTSLSHLQLCPELRFIKMHGVGIDLRAAAEFQATRPEVVLEYDQIRAPDLRRFLKKDSSLSSTTNEPRDNQFSTGELHDVSLNLNIPEDVSLLKYLPQLTSLQLTGLGVNDSALQFIAEMPNLKVLDLSRSKLTDSAIQRLPVFRQLEHIILTDTHISNSTMHWLAETPGLRFLNLSGCPFDSMSDNELLHFPALKYMELSRSRNSQQIITRLKAPVLGRIRLGSCGLTDQDLSSLAAFPKLWAVDLSGNPFEGHGLKSLQELQLDTLELGGSGLTDEGLKTISSFRRITDFHRLMNLDVSGTAISGIGFQATTDVPVYRVDLSDLELSHEGFDAICRLKKLGALDLRRTVLPKDSLQSLSKSPSVAQIAVDGNDEIMQALATEKKPVQLSSILIYHADSNALDLLREFPDIETIGLSHCDIDESAASMILRAAKCSRLELLECEISDEAIQLLASSKTLVHIDMVGMDGVPIEAANLQLANPALSIRKIELINSSMADQQEITWRFSGNF